MNNNEYLKSLETKYKKQLEDDPASNCFVLLAGVLIKLKKTDDALKVLVNGLRHNKENTTARFLLGKIYFERWLIDNAKNEFEKVIKLAPDNIAVSKILLQIYISEGNNKRVLEISDKLAFYHPGNQDLLDFIEELKSGQQPLELNDIVDEQSAFRSGVKIKKEPEAGTGKEIVSTILADLYFDQGYYSESLELYNKLLLNNPEDQRIIERIEKIKSLDMSSEG